MNTYSLQGPCLVGQHRPLGTPISSATLFNVAYQIISLCPDGGLFEAWALQSRVRAQGIDVGMHIAIC